MAFLTTIGIWIASNVPTLVKASKKIVAFVHKAERAVDAFNEGRRVIDIEAIPIERSRSKKTLSRPNRLTLEEDNRSEQEFVALEAMIDERKRDLHMHVDVNEQEHKNIHLQVEILELVASVQTFERHTTNIKLHASNLSIHLQTIRNTHGLVSDVNRQRVAIKALIQTVNHLCNKTGSSDSKISGIDIDMRQGAISINDAYTAFEETRELLIGEIDAFVAYIKQLEESSDRVRKMARSVPAMAKVVNKWLSETIEPSLSDSRKQALSVKADLEIVPRIESNLKLDLKAGRIESED